MSVIYEDSDTDNNENESPAQKVARRPKRKRDSPVSQDLEKLKAARQNLQNDGNDPLQESQRIAATATRNAAAAAAAAATSPKTGSLLRPKKSAQQIQFGDSSDDDDSDDNRAQLSDMPPHAKLAKQQIPPSQATTRSPKKRIPYSEAEKLAIREGVRKHGFGNWSKIKSDPEYAIILMRRTNVNIKDCYRTLKEKGEI